MTDAANVVGACLVACFCSLAASRPAFAQSTFNAFNCNSAGSYSTCHVPDGTKIDCYNGAYSECTVTHPNGQTGEGPGAAALLIGALVRLHQEHAANKAAKNAEAAVQVSLKGAVLSSDWAAFWKADASYIASFAPKESEPLERLQQELRQQSSDMFNLASLLARQLDKDRWRFYAGPKRYQQIHDLSLERACSLWRVSAQIKGMFLPLSTHPQFPPQVKVALDAVKADEGSLDADCTSKEAEKARRYADKLLKEHPKNRPKE